MTNLYGTTFLTELTNLTGQFTFIPSHAILLISHCSMSPELLLEISLYCIFLATVLVFRLSSASKKPSILDRTAIAVSPPRKIRTKPFTKKPKADEQDVQNWRAVMQPPNFCQKPEKLVIDLGRAFTESAKKKHPNVPCPPPPPPSPAYVQHSEAGEPRTNTFGLDHSFVQYIQFTHSQYDEGAATDSDHLRRRKYMKHQITDGEVMMTIQEKFQICQVFVFGIEYHYVHVTGKGSVWELPEEIKSACINWFLALPKAKQKKFCIGPPPDPLCHKKHLHSQPTFAPLGFHL